MADDTRQCEGCCYWKRIDPGDVYSGDCVPDEAEFGGDPEMLIGQCRRFPPIVSDDAMRTSRLMPCYADKNVWNELTTHGMVFCATKWPITWNDHWCGEFSETQEGDIRLENSSS